jgi:hypothetical protein
MPVSTLNALNVQSMGVNVSGAPAPTRAQSLPLPDSPLATQLSFIHQAHDVEQGERFLSEMQALGGAERDAPAEAHLPLTGEGSDEVGASELSDALAEPDRAGGRPPPSEPPFSVDDALDFRVNQFQSAQTLADELLAQVGLAMEHARDPAALQKLKTVYDGLQRFKTDAKAAESRDRERAEQLRAREQAVQTASERLRLAKQLLGGTVKKPFAAKTWQKFKLIDGIRARFQQASIRRAGKNGEAFQPPGSPLHLRTALATHLAGVMSAAPFPGTGANALQKQLVLHAAKDVEQRMSWNTIDNGIELQGPNGAAQSFTNVQQPARVFSPALAEAYGPGRLGVSCMNSAEPEHVVNLWKTDFRAPGQAGLAFSALRHGIHDAYALKSDPKARSQAADARVEEFVRTVAQTYPQRLTESGEELGGRPIIDVPVVSMSLVSPARFGGEGAMWANQRAAYTRANEGVLKATTIDLADGQGPREVLLRPRIIGFNTPVTTFALESGALMQRALGGWEESDAANGPALEALIGPPGQATGGLAGTRLAELRSERTALAPGQTDDARAKVASLDARIARAETLINQIRSIVAAPTDSALSHHRAGHEPYKLPVRLAALANELNLPVAFNCKSGKDRTGQLDVEIKALYASMALNGGAVPEPGREPTAIERGNRARLFNEAGSFEIQKHNTAVPGGKINVSVLKSQLKRAMRDALPEDMRPQVSRQVIKEHIKGLSTWVGS